MKLQGILIVILKEYGVGHIRIGEGSVRRSGEKNPDQAKGARLIFQALGYACLEKKYGVELVDFFEEPFQKTDFGDFSLNISQAVLESDFVNMPVLKTHNQTRVSLGFKNLKGCIDLESRRLCHNVDVSLELHDQEEPEGPEHQGSDPDERMSRDHPGDPEKA